MSDVPPSPGALVQDNLGDIRCGKMSFNGDGTIAAVVFCNDFEVLSR
jgi:hypothetical protein